MRSENLKTSIEHHIRISQINLSDPPDEVILKLLASLAPSLDTIIQHRAEFWQTLQTIGPQGPALATAFADLIKKCNEHDCDLTSKDKAQIPNLRGIFSRR
jgi:hypothetical protein